MGEWISRLNFALFYSAVYSGNTNNHQYENVSILLDGIRLNTNQGTPKEALRQDTASRYCRGEKAIGKTKAAELIGMSDKQLIQRISETSISDMGAAVRTLANLLKSGHIDLDAVTMNEALAIPYREEPKKFLCRTLRIAINCPQMQMVKLTEEMKEDILSFRKSEDSTSEAVREERRGKRDAPRPPIFHFRGSMSAFEIMEMDYEKHRDQIKKILASDVGEQVILRLKQDEVLSCLDLIRRSEAAYMIRFDGAADALIDILIHRISYHQCLEAALIGKVKSKEEFQRMRELLTNIAYYALDDEGKLFISCGLDDSMQEDEYDFTVVYSVKSLTRDQQMKVSIAQNQMLHPLTPWEQFRGRVPSFLEPGSEELKKG